MTVKSLVNTNLSMFDVTGGDQPLYQITDSDGERAFRGAALMADLNVAARVGTIFSAEATSNERIEIAYPGISTWKITAIGRAAHPTEP